jgi:hypothetical protein
MAKAKTKPLSEAGQRAYDKMIRECADEMARAILRGDPGGCAMPGFRFSLPGPTQAAVRAALLKGDYVRSTKNEYGLDVWRVTRKAYDKVTSDCAGNVVMVRPDGPEITETDYERSGIPVRDLEARQVAWILAHREEYEFVGVYNYSCTTQEPKERPVIVGNRGVDPGIHRTLFIRSISWRMARDAMAHQAKITRLCNANFAWAIENIAGFDADTAKAVVAAGSGDAFLRSNLSLATFDPDAAFVQAEKDLAAATVERNAIAKFVVFLVKSGGWEAFKASFRARLEAEVAKEEKA